MRPPIPTSENQRERAFRSLAVARRLSLNHAPGADDAYDHAHELAESAIMSSSTPLETEFSRQLSHIVADDRRRHQQVANTADFPPAVEM